MADRLIHKLLHSTLTPKNDSQVQKSKLELYLGAVFCNLNATLRARITEEVAVSLPTEEKWQVHVAVWPSPATLFDRDPMFREYVESKVNWARAQQGKSLAVQRSMVVGAICNYNFPKFGWVAFKEEHGQRGNDQTYRAKAQGDGETGSVDKPATDSARAYQRYLSDLEGTR